MENFSNTILFTGDLPELDAKEFKGLDRKYLNVSITRAVLLFLILIISLITVLFLNKGIPTRPVALIGGSSILLAIAISIVFTILGFPRKGYLLREHDISFLRGLITFKQTTVPFNRIQHVEVNQGVLDKILHLASMKIYTAGGKSSDLNIPGIPVDDAEKLKTFLSEKISRYE